MGERLDKPCFFIHPGSAKSDVIIIIIIIYISIILLLYYYYNIYIYIYNNQNLGMIMVNEESLCLSSRLPISLSYRRKL